MTTPSPKAAPQGALRVAEVPRERMVLVKDLENLRSSGLTDETITLAGVYTETESKELARILHWSKWLRSTMGSGLVFPYRIPGEAEPVFARVRPQRPRVTDKRGKRKQVKYEQAKGVPIAPYFPPRSGGEGRLAGDATLYITEGEKKALLLDQLGYATIGLAGVWNFHDVDAYDPQTREGLKLHPLLAEHVMLAGRACVIAYDADFETNPAVKAAAQRLAGCLVAAGARSVTVAIPPDAASKQGIDDYCVAHGEDAARALLEHGQQPIEVIEPDNPLPRLRANKALRDAPVDEAMLCPAGYEVDERTGQLWKLAETEKQSDKRVSPSPLLLRRVLVDLYTGEERAEVVFKRRGTWVTQCVERSALVESRRIVGELAPMGAPITSNSAAMVVDWLEALEHINGERIPRVFSVARAGWHELQGAVPAFVLDSPLSDGETPELALDDRGDRRRIFQALAPRGKLEAHVDALKVAWEASPTAAAMIAGALAAPLLRKLHAPNFAIHLPGDSSRGKTSMLKCAASVYGDPESEKWVASWNTTAVAAELRAAALTDLPLCFDEVGAGDMRQTEKLVYMLVNGGGRSRGQKDMQLRETPSWHTVVLSTGEHELATENANTGAQVRVLQLPVGGFGEMAAEEVDQVRDDCVTNAGHVGREWMQQLLAVADWSEYRDAYKAYTRHMRSGAVGSLWQRMAAYYAVLAVAETVASDAFGIGQAGGLGMQQLFFAGREGRQSDVRPLADRAIDLVVDWLHSEPRAFPDMREDAAGEQVPSVTGGNVVHGYRNGPGELWLLQKQFTDFCERYHMSPREVLRAFLERGWLQPGKSRLPVQRRIAGRPTWVVLLNLPIEDPDP